MILYIRHTLNDFVMLSDALCGLGPLMSIMSSAGSDQLIDLFSSTRSHHEYKMLYYAVTNSREK